MSGRASSMQREIQWMYKHLREEDILDMLPECEADENYSKSAAPGGLGIVGAGSGISGLSTLHGNRGNGINAGRFYNHGPILLSSMPTIKRLADVVLRLDVWNGCGSGDNHDVVLLLSFSFFFCLRRN